MGEKLLNLATLLNYQLEHSRSSGGQILSRTGEIAAPRRSLRPDPRIAGCERGNFKLEHPTHGGGGGDGRYHYLYREPRISVIYQSTMQTPILNELQFSSGRIFFRAANNTLFLNSTLIGDDESASFGLRNRRTW